MTPTQWHAVCDEVESLWGTSAKWKNAKDAVWKFAQNIDAQTAHDMIERYFMSNKVHPPSPSEVISQTVTAGGIVADTRPCTHRNYAILEYWEDGTGKTGLCAACHTEIHWPAGRIRTMGDWEERAKAKVGSEPDVPI